MTVDIHVAREIVEAHRDRLLNGAPVSVASILLDVGRCPSCAAPLLRGDHTAICTSCGSEVDQP